MKFFNCFLLTLSGQIYPANDHLIEFHLIEIVIFHLIKISLIT